MHQNFPLARTLSSAVFFFGAIISTQKSVTGRRKKLSNTAEKELMYYIFDFWLQYRYMSVSVPTNRLPITQLIYRYHDPGISVS